MVWIPIDNEFTDQAQSQQIARQVMYVAKDFSQNPRILEVGCGTGNILEAIAEISPENELFGVEYAEEPFNIAKQKLGDRATIYHESAAKMSFESGSMPLILEHRMYKPYNFEDTFRSITKEIVRLLPIGGKFMTYQWYDGKERDLEDFGCEHLNTNVVYQKVREVA